MSHGTFISMSIYSIDGCPRERIVHAKSYPMVSILLLLKISLLSISDTIFLSLVSYWCPLIVGLEEVVVMF